MSDHTKHVLEGWARNELRVQRCEVCNAKQFPPREVCLACRSQRLAWEVILPRGAVVSFTIVHRAPTPSWKARVPYAIALVDCEPGVRLMMNVDTPAPEALEIGMEIKIELATFEGEAQPRPLARPTVAIPAD